MPIDGYDMHMLSVNIEQAKTGSRQFDRQLAQLFGRTVVERWTDNLEAAANLFKDEFSDWSRNCLSNSCQGIYWYIDHDKDDASYGAVAETDALALCAAMVKAKRREFGL